MRLEHRELAIELRHGCRNERALLEKTRVVDEKARGEIVRTIGNNVVASNQIERIRGSQPGRMWLHDNMRIDRERGISRRQCLGPTDIARSMRDLALQIGEAHRVVVDDADRSDTGRGQIEYRWATQTACADHQHAGSLQLGLTYSANFPQDNVARVALELCIRKAHRRKV